MSEATASVDSAAEGQSRLFAVFITHTHERIARSVMSMACQSLPPDEIAVACDGDSDKIHAEVARAATMIGRRVLLVRRTHTGEARPAQTRNNAVRAIEDRFGLSDHDRLVFFDGDCMAPPDVLAVHSAALVAHEITLGWRVELTEAQTADLTDASVLSGKIGNIPNDEQRAEVAKKARTYQRRDWQRTRGLTKPHKPQVLGANFGVRASVYKAINGMDETFTGWGMEDDDIGRRVYASGGSPGLRLRRCVVLHQFHPTRSTKAWMDNTQAHRIDKPFEVVCAQGLTNPLKQTEPTAEMVGDTAPIASDTTDAQDPFFVVGTGRCGSTLFQAMLMSHPGVRMPPETQYFEHLDPGRLGFGDTIAPSDADAYLNKALSERARFFLDATEGTCAAYAEAVRGGLLSARDQFLWICDRLSAGQTGGWIGEKTPQHWKFIDRIEAIFPNARFVHLVRDPRDVVAGLHEMDWWPNKSCTRTAKYWRNTIDAAWDGVQRDATRHMLVRYEGLIERPETVLRAVSRFLGFGFDHAMLDHRQSASRSFHENESSYKGRTLGAIDRSRMGRYRSKLSPRDIRLIEQTIGIERMERMGYALDPDVDRPVWSPFEPAAARVAESVGLGASTTGGTR